MTSIWEYIEKGIEGREEGLRGIVADKIGEDTPHANLLIAVIIQAAKDRDYDYFKSGDFDYYCELLKLNQQYVMALFNRAWAIDREDSWSPPEVEDADIYGSM